MRRILIVDDNVAFAENLAEIIEDACGENVEVEVADSGARALELLATKGFDTMLTDMRMPQMSGAQLVHAARDIDPGLPIVVITAFSEDQQLEQAARDGVLAVMSKPVTIQRLVQLVQQARPGIVAVIDDDAALVDNLVEVLHDRGMTAVTAHSIADIELLGGEPWLAIVDLRLPGGSDGAALTRVGARFPGAARIVVTAFSAGIEVPPHVELLEKPFEMERLLATIERLCHERQQ